MRSSSRLALAGATLIVGVLVFQAWRLSPRPRLRVSDDGLLRVGTGTVEGVDRVAADLAGISLVFVGEIHDEASHHAAQLAMIRAVHRTGRPLAVGLEMIQARHQLELDRWVRGETSEDAIRATFAADWHFPWELYREIFLFARERRIPLVGLNLDEGIPRRVAQDGFQSLDRRQREELPPVSCDVDATYADFIRRALGEHGRTGATFLHFCEAQRVWDVTMAWNLIRYLKAHPGTQVIVLAGSGHSWKRGIPEEVARQSPASCRVILPQIKGTLEAATADPQDADYLWLGLD